MIHWSGVNSSHPTRIGHGMPTSLTGKTCFSVWYTALKQSLATSHSQSLSKPEARSDFLLNGISIFNRRNFQKSERSTHNNMATLNQCSFIGRLGKDPEMSYTPN